MALFVVLQILRTLSWPGAHSAPEQRVFRTAEELKQAWVADGGAPSNLPPVDFEKEMVLAVFAGKKPTGGHAIKIERVAVKGPDANPTVCVLYRQTAPAPDVPVAQAITYPSHAVVVKKTDGTVEWFDVASQSGRALAEAIQSAQKMEARTTSLNGCLEHKQNVWSVANQLTAAYPDWATTAKPSADLVVLRERVFHSIRTYRFMLDGHNAAFKEKPEPYDPAILELEKKIVEHQRTAVR
jgi:hypothetical protein